MVEAAGRLRTRWTPAAVGTEAGCAGTNTGEEEMGQRRSGEIEAMARGLRGESPPPGYIRCMEEMSRLIPQWIEQQCQMRALDLQWHAWGKTVFAGSIGGDRSKWLAASPDAMALLDWLDEKTNREGTLLQAKVVLESLGIKPREDH